LYRFFGFRNAQGHSSKPCSLRVTLNCLDGLHNCGKRFFEAVQAGLAPNLTCLTGQEDVGYELIDEDADFPCLIETIKSEFCAFKELELPSISWDAEKASLLIDALRSPNCKLEKLKDKFVNSLFENSQDDYGKVNVDEACLELSRQFGVPAE
jgi:hypothetical protein